MAEDKAVEDVEYAFMFTKRQAALFVAGVLLVLVGAVYGTFLHLRHVAQHAAAAQFQQDQQRLNQELVVRINQLLEGRK